MNQTKLFIADIVSFFYGTLFKKKLKKNCRILMYHNLSFLNINENKSNIYDLDINLFKKQMNFLNQNSILNKEKKIVSLENGILSSEGIVLTFDDGYSNILTKVAPILAEYNFPFAIFIAPKFIIENNAKYLSIQNLKKLSRIPNVTIGAHSFSHIRLTDCDDSKLQIELNQSKKWLEDTLSIPINSMSYPHGAFDERVKQAVSKAGYKFALSSNFGSFSFDDDLLNVSRIDIWSHDNLTRFKKKINGYWDWLGSNKNV